MGKRCSETALCLLSPLYLKPSGLFSLPRAEDFTLGGEGLQKATPFSSFISLPPQRYHLLTPPPPPDNATSLQTVKGEQLISGKVQ